MGFWGRRNAAAEIVRVLLGDGCVGDLVCGAGGREALGICTSDGVISAACRDVEPFALEREGMGEVEGEVPMITELGCSFGV